MSDTPAHIKIKKLHQTIQESYKIDPSNMILKAFINALYQDESLIEYNLQKAWIKIWNEQLLIDNTSYALLVRNKSVTVHETLTKTVFRISRELGVIISAVPFSTSQTQYLQEEKLPIPLTHEKIPSIYPPPSNISDTSIVLVKALSKQTGDCIDRQQYTTKSLLDSARKVVKGSIILTVVETKLGRKEIACQGPWNNKEDQLEMLRKTAVRKFIKYMSR